VGFLGFFCGLAGLLLCILLVYLGAPYTFFNEILLLTKKLMEDVIFKRLTFDVRPMIEV
jgi:hypothetical protein